MPDPSPSCEGAQPTGLIESAEPSRKRSLDTMELDGAERAGGGEGGRMTRQRSGAGLWEDAEMSSPEGALAVVPVGGEGDAAPARPPWVTALFAASWNGCKEVVRKLLGEDARQEGGMACVQGAGEDTRAGDMEAVRQLLWAGGGVDAQDGSGEP